MDEARSLDLLAGKSHLSIAFNAARIGLNKWLDHAVIQALLKKRDASKWSEKPCFQDGFQIRRFCTLEHIESLRQYTVLRDCLPQVGRFDDTSFQHFAAPRCPL
jgi:hypothetical protein